MDFKNIKIIFSDLDGTLLNSDSQLPDINAEAIEEVRKKGILFVAATARPERAISEYCAKVNFDGVISLNGAQVHFKDKRINKGMSYETSKRIIGALCEKDNKIVVLETSAGIYSNTILPDWFVEKEDDLLEVIKSCTVFKILVIGQNNKFIEKTRDEETLLTFNEIHEEVESLMDDKAYYSISENWIHQIMAKTDTKWNAVCEVLETLGISKDEAMYFGDDNDDVESIQNIGFGIAMGNAIPRAKEASRLIIGKNDDAGVAMFLRQNIL